MSFNAEQHRLIIDEILDANTFEHQRSAASKAHAKFAGGSRAVVIAAEMQSGKSGDYLINNAVWANK